MTESELSEIEARSNAATPGPWLAKTVANTGRMIVDSEKTIVTGYCEDSDALLIAHARDDIPKLLAEVRKLREWKRKHQGHHIGEYNVNICINECMGTAGSEPYSELSEPVRHSPDCPDFTVDGELK